MKRRRKFACLLLGVLLMMACGRDDSDQKQATPVTPEPKHEAAPPAAEAPRVVELTLSFVAPRFRPNPVVVQVGKPVQFKIFSMDTRHTLVIEALGLEVEVPQKSLSESVLSQVVTPQETGTFRMFCRIHSRLPMEGTLVVSATAGQ
jgi:plastocyanin